MLTSLFETDPLPGCNITERYHNPCHTVVFSIEGRTQIACYFPTVLENNLYVSRGEDTAAITYCNKVTALDPQNGWQTQVSQVCSLCLDLTPLQFIQVTACRDFHTTPAFYFLIVVRPASVSFSSWYWNERVRWLGYDPDGGARTWERNCPV